MRRLVPLLLAVMVACGQVPAPTLQVEGMALAGPVCPVETSPPDPGCASRPVTGATIEALDSEENVVATAVTGGDGSFTLSLPAGGYTIVGRPVEGLLGTPPPVMITVVDGPVDVGILAYDTGIR